MRAPLDTEREMLARLPSVDFDGAEVLRIQAANILGAEPNCACGCPSITPHMDRDAAPPARCRSPLPVELAEMSRADGIPRTVTCFLDPDGYVGNLECDYLDDARPEWPRADQCAILLSDDQGRLEAVALPSGALVRPRERGDRWVSFEPQGDGGFCAATWSGYRECFARDGSEIARTFGK